MNGEVKCLTVAEAARLMGKSKQFIRIGLQRGAFPFGSAVKTSSKWSYYINSERFRKWMAGDDLTHTIQEGGQAYES